MPAEMDQRRQSHHTPISAVGRMVTARTMREGTMFRVSV